MELYLIFLTLGALFLLGLFADQVGRRTRLPRVTLLLLCGVAVGGAGLDLLPLETEYWYEFLTIAALTMVAFLLGNSLSLKNLRKPGSTIMAISLSVVVVTIAVVGGLFAFGAVFALNSSLHSFLILAYADDDDVSLDVGFYYSANALGRLVGTFLSGLLYLWGGLTVALWGAAAFVCITWLLTLRLPSIKHLAPA